MSRRARPMVGSRAAVAPLIVTALVGLSACSTGTAPASTPDNPTPTSGSTSATAKTTSAATSTAQEVSARPCVANVAQVIARKPTSQMTSATLPKVLIGKLDAAARTSFGQASTPGAVVGVRSPAGTWTRAYGKADPRSGTPMTVGVHTRIGSITKTFTGTVVMQLAQQGGISLNDTIGKYVPGVPNGDRITLRQLGNMTSGVASYTQSRVFTDTYFAKPQTVFTPPQLLKVGIAASPVFKPGEKFDYSNTNTVLLGMVIEKVTGKPVEQAYRRLILDPLKLANTSWPGQSTTMPAPYAQGFTLQGDSARPDAPSNSTHWNPAWGWTAGEMISTIDDLLVYGRALGTGQGLLDPKSQTQRLTSFPAPAGYGIAVGCIGGWVGHSGELPGYNTSLFYDSTTDTTVAVQTNSDIPSGKCEQSPTLTDDPHDLVCSSPATRIFVALSKALGHPFTPNPQH